MEKYSKYNLCYMEWSVLGHNFRIIVVDVDFILSILV